MRSLKTGTVIGDYRIISEIGAGGLGQVFKAVHLRNHVTVALKVIRESLYCNRKFIGKFHQEIIVHSSLQHRNIVRYYDSCFKPPRCYIATEFIDGWSGSEFIKKCNGELPPLVALSIVFQILQGLDHLHVRDFMHYDLSAGNFLVERSGRIVLTDFGLSSKYENHKNYLIGTPGYYSPEHIASSALDCASDTYCVGLILYELINGQRAVTASKDRKLISSLMKKISFDILCSDSKMRLMLTKVLRKALSFEIAKRYNSAHQMLYDCYLILEAFRIRYPRQAVLRYLAQSVMIETDAQEIQEGQDIYRGFERSKPKSSASRSVA